MLPVKYRLNRQKLPLALKKSTVFSSPYFKLRLHLRDKEEADFGQTSKFSFVIANKVLPRSVDRHLLKRQIHAIIEDFWPKLGNNKDLVVQAVKNPLTLSFNDLKQEVLDLFRLIK